MNPKRLYIIGNGFDLFHGVPSELKDFKAYVKKSDDDIYQDVELYLPVGEDWSSLEQSLADMNPGDFEEHLGYFMASYSSEGWSDSSHHDFQVEVKKRLERLSFGLRSEFSTWIRKLPIPNAYGVPKKMANLDKGGLYFNFNYTDTLSSIYEIPNNQILFIHGRAGQPDEEIILGHGWDPQIREALLSPDQMEEADFRLVEAYSLIDEFFSETFKKSEQLLKRNAAFFDRLGQIEEVYVLGHSLSNVDKLYFLKLLESGPVKSAKWYIASRSEDEWQYKLSQLKSFGGVVENTSPIVWS